MITNLFMWTISFSAVLLFGCLGEILTEKSGNLNLGIPGIMCVGAAGGCWFVSIYMNMFESHPIGIFLVLSSILGSFLFAMVIGLIYSFLTITLKCNQNITGLAITIFGSGFTEFFMANFADSTYYGLAHTYFIKQMPFANNLGWFGKVFLSHGIMTYLSIAIAIIMAFFFKKTKAGLHLRAVGENPATADAAGINVTKHKYFATMIGSGIAGLGGLYYTLGQYSSWEQSSVIEGLGWLCVALVIFALWRPILGIVGSIIFSMLYIFKDKITGIFTIVGITQYLGMLPYIVTIIVLIFTSIFGKKSVQPPASLGLPYFREER